MTTEVNESAEADESAEANGPEVDVEKPSATAEAVTRLRRLADALEAEKTFEIQIAGERIYVPPYATVEFEYERDGDDRELEIEIKWRKKAEE